jgi:dTDP-4-dehydrorhamnose reductase
MKIIILGANGQLGKSLKKIFQKTSYKFYFFNKSDLDINDHKTLNKKFISIKPDIIINCCAYTAVDKAEENFEEANNVNNVAVGKLAQQCLNNDCFLIHVSTDYVFDGLSENPYVENDKKNPIGVYGKTKLDGEYKILKSGCKFCIIRTSWIFGEFGNNFLKTMLKLASKNDELSVISDQVSSPTYSGDISQTILTILPFIKKGTITNEIFHYSGNTFCSWYEFAKIIIEVAKEKNILKKKPTLKSITTSEYSALAKRPLNSSLSSEKIFKQVNIKPSDWKKNIENVIMILKKQQYIKV